LETRKCPVCGAFVKKENLKRHNERVHPRLPGSAAQQKTPIGTAPVFRSHRKRNMLVLTLVILASVGVASAVSQFAAANTMRMHWHPQLSITINGNPFTVPADIGISAELWKDHSLDQYGIGMSPLHTHDTSGTIHEESNTVRDFTLKQFLAIWGQSVDANQVMDHPVNSGHRAYITVDGTEMPATSDPIMKDGMKTQIVCGP